MKTNSFEIITQKIDNILNIKNDTLVIVAIDGHCTSGKTTLSKFLDQKYNCNIFHMDDFFLRPEQRTKERLNEIGGNIDYERFNNEVLLPLKSGKSFNYRPYDCHSTAFKNQVKVIPKKLNIIEGSYSMHPLLSSAYDLTIFLNISPELQKERILKRDKSLHQKFFDIWIPMENRYFNEYKISEKCDITINEIQIKL